MPCCGSGYDVIALAGERPTRRVVGLDVFSLACERGEHLRAKAGL